MEKKQTVNNQKFSALYTFKGLEKIKVETLESGDIIAIAGIDNIQIGDTISSNDESRSLFQGLKLMNQQFQYFFM